MDVQKKLEQFSNIVFEEASKHKAKMLENIEAEYSNSVSSFENETKKKFDRRYEEETNKAKREVQKDISEAQTDFKRTLITKRARQIDDIFGNVRKKLTVYFGTDEYLRSIVDLINANKKAGGNTIVYLVERDMTHKGFIEKETGVTIKLSSEDITGGLKISLSDNRVADFTIRSKLEEELAKFNKIRF